MRRLVMLTASWLLVACSGDGGRTVELEAWPQVGRTIEVSSVVDGDTDVDERFDRRWSRSVTVSDSFDISLEVVDRAGEQVRCSIDIDGFEPVAAVGNGLARCEAAGRLVDGELVVETDTFGAVRPPASDTG